MRRGSSPDESMNHHLSSVRRSPWLRVACVLLLAVMFAPAAMAAASSAPVGLPLASTSHGASAFLAAGVGGAFLMLRSPEGGEGGGGGGSEPKAEDVVDPEAALKQAEDPTLTLGARFKVMVAALKGVPPAKQFQQVQADLTAAQAAITERDGEITRLKAELKAANDQLAARQADLDALDQEKTTLATENAQLKAADKDLNKRASEQAKNIVQSVGIDASALPGPASETAKTPEERIRELKGSQRTEAALYFRQHKKLPEWMNN